MADIQNPTQPEEVIDAPAAESTEVETTAEAVEEPVTNETHEEDEAEEAEAADESEREGTTAHRTPETEQAMGILQVEEYINQQMVDIAKMREEMRLVKSTVDDSFQNDAQYRELETKAKETAKVKNAYKKQMMNDPAVAEQANKLDGMKSEMRDMSVALSDYLREYNRLSGMSQFETRDGEVLEIINVFKLVKKKE